MSNPRLYFKPVSQLPFTRHIRSNAHLEAPLLSKSGLESAPSRRLAIPFHPPTVSGLNLVTVPRRLKQRTDEGKEVGTMGLRITLQRNTRQRMLLGADTEGKRKLLS